MHLNRITQTVLSISLLMALLSPVFIYSNFSVQAAQPPGATTAPYKVTYTAKLMDSTGNPIITAQDIRFSLWSDSDWTAPNFDGAGNIVIASPNYAGWQETHTVTPNSEGIFTVELGSINIFPNVTLGAQNYLEVDVKPQPSPNTAFEVLDPDGVLSNTTDRKPFNSAPYAINADTVDNKDASNTPNNIPVLDGTGKLIYGVLPDGVNADTFTLDVDNNAPANVITLQFGQAVAQYLRWNNPASRFELSNSLNVNGNLTFTGTAQITGATIDGTLNTLQNIPFTAIAPHVKVARLTPKYPDSTLSPDGSNNIGTLKSEYQDGGAGARYNYYLWTTNLPIAQDMDLVVRYQLPADFVSFTATPVTLTYQTADAVVANNSLNLSINDSIGATVGLTGGTNLTSAATWTTAAITFSGSPTFTAGSFIEFRLHAASINGGKYVRIGDLVLNYNGR